MLKIDPEKIVSELKMFQGGVADTSTLIYLDSIDLLLTAGRVFQLLVPPDVVQEFGDPLPGCMICGMECNGNADRAVVQLALERSMPVLSEDRQLLKHSRRLGLQYYNTLMILLALLHQQKLTLDDYQKAYFSLRGTARYSPAVWQVGQQVFSLFVR